MLIALAMTAFAGVAQASGQALPGDAGALRAAPSGTVEEPPEGRVRIPAEIPVRRDKAATGGGGGALRGVVGAAMAAILAVVVVQARRRRTVPAARPLGGAGGWFRWLVPAHGSGALRVMHSARLTPRASVHVVRWSGEEWLVGCADQGLSLLGHRPVEEERASSNGPAKGPDDRPGPEVGNEGSAS